MADFERNRDNIDLSGRVCSLCGRFGRREKEHKRIRKKLHALACSLSLSNKPRRVSRPQT